MVDLLLTRSVNELIGCTFDAVIRLLYRSDSKRKELLHGILVAFWNMATGF